MKILITGSAGFIGFHLSKRLLEKKYQVYGLDNINNYYDTSLKKKRISLLKKLSTKKFKFIKLDLQNKNKLNELFVKYKFDIVINLAAQAGVRYSIENPKIYLQNNIDTFLNLLECSWETCPSFWF